MKQLGYFAFGSNLLRKQMEERIAPEQMIEEGRARLSDYRIAFNKERKNDGTGKANIVPDPKGTVWGVAYRISEAALVKMDRWEGVSGGHDVRKIVKVLDDEVELEAVTYVAGDTFINNSLRPSPKYLETILTGAQEHGLPEEYIESLKAFGSPRSEAPASGLRCCSRRPASPAAEPYGLIPQRWS
ncbi:MAG: gamma-glutamylcyclotransferase [Isosphaeraceae bacterium]|nr:MAG: gamma-glutamylcyclotransferase [Isosphaeraceae bacterium]